MKTKIYIFSFFSLNDGLINYWSFTNNVYDSVGSAHLFNGLNAMLTNDRFNRPNSALDLNSGYYQAPNGVYFNTTFSITAWFYARQISIGEPLIDFGFIHSGFPNIMLYLTYTSSRSPLVRITDVSGNRYQIVPNLPTPLFSWTHMVSTFNGSFLNLHLNGTLVGSTPSAYPTNIVRTSYKYSENQQFHW